MIEPAGGEIVEEFFDIGQSRSLPWKRRPEAARLLDAFRDPDRGFDAVVIGEPQRAFYGNQFGLTFPVFVHYGVELWVPEVGGAVDPGSDAHDLVMSLYGGMSKGERNRIKTRVRSAMAAQAAIEGRFLGGRPPYGYVLADAGPHPNPGKAADGQRLHVLAPDPVAAPVVARIFDEFVAGTGLYAIAEGLTRDGIPSPSAHDRARNPHRQPAVAPGRRARSGRSCRTPATPAARSGTASAATRCSSTSRTSRSATRRRCAGTTATTGSGPSSRPTSRSSPSRCSRRRRLVFAGAQRSHVRRDEGARGPYVLSGMVRCGVCGRRMQGILEPRPAPTTAASSPPSTPSASSQHPKTVYVKEASILPALDGWLAGLFDDDNIDQTCAALEATTGPDPAEEARSAPPAGELRRVRRASSPATAPPSRPAPTPRSSPAGSKR